MTKGGAAEEATGRLYVVATPIGNLADITLRALDVLRSVDVVAVEDTRVSAVLLAHHGIHTRLLSLHEHNEARRSQDIVALLQAGKQVALVADAGTPAISDPGARVVRAVVDAGFEPVAVPGPSALAAAWSVAGMRAEKWLFAGFLPASSGHRKAALAALQALPVALVFYEAPHRIAAMLAALAEILGGEREAVVAREITKRFETLERGTLAMLAPRIAAGEHSQRGEFVVIVDAPPAPAAAPENEHDALLDVLLGEVPLVQAVRIATALTGSGRKRLYARALERRDAREERARAGEIAGRDEQGEADDPARGDALSGSA